MNKMWYIHTTEYYFTLKWKGILTHTIWMNFIFMVLNLTSQSLKDHCCIILLHEVPRVVKLIEIGDVEWQLPGPGERRGMEIQCLMGTEFHLGKMKNSGDGTFKEI